MCGSQNSPQRSQLLLLTPLFHPLHILPELVCVCPDMAEVIGCPIQDYTVKYCGFCLDSLFLSIPFPLSLNQLISYEDTQACSKTLRSLAKCQWRVETFWLPCEDPGTDPPNSVKLQVMQLQPDCNLMKDENHTAKSLLGSQSSEMVCEDIQKVV